MKNIRGAAAVYGILMVVVILGITGVAIATGFNPAKMGLTGTKSFFGKGSASCSQLRLRTLSSTFAKNVETEGAVILRLTVENPVAKDLASENICDAHLQRFLLTLLSDIKLNGAKGTLTTLVEGTDDVLGKSTFTKFPTFETLSLQGVVIPPGEKKVILVKLQIPGAKGMDMKHIRLEIPDQGFYSQNNFGISNSIPEKTINAGAVLIKQ